jgi:hypothetical protein
MRLVNHGAISGSFFLLLFLHQVIRWAGYFRSYLWAAYRIINPRVYNGTLYYLPADSPEECSQLPPVGEPVPASWCRQDGGFLNVYATKQSWLDYSLVIAPQVIFNWKSHMYIIL